MHALQRMKEKAGTSQSCLQQLLLSAGCYIEWLAHSERGRSNTQWNLLRQECYNRGVHTQVRIRYQKSTSPLKSHPSKGWVTWLGQISPLVNPFGGLWCGDSFFKAYLRIYINLLASRSLGWKMTLPGFRRSNQRERIPKRLARRWRGCLMSV